MSAAGVIGQVRAVASRGVAIATAWGLSVEDLLDGSSGSDGRVVDYSEVDDIESVTATVFG